MFSSRKPDDHLSTDDDDDDDLQRLKPIINKRNARRHSFYYFRVRIFQTNMFKLRFPKQENDQLPDDMFRTILSRRRRWQNETIFPRKIIEKTCRTKTIVLELICLRLYKTRAKNYWIFAQKTIFGNFWFCYIVVIQLNINTVSRNLNRTFMLSLFVRGTIFKLLFL